MWRLGLLVGVAGVAAALALERLPHPWVWIGAIGLGTAIAAWRGSRRLPVRLAIFHLGFAILLLTGLEVFFALRHDEPFSGDYNERGRYFVGHDELGYALQPGRATKVRKQHRGELLYEVLYTIDEHGLRVAPPVAEGAGAECILFFGGSFTFGEGVDDEETLPYRVGLLGGGRHRVYNFGMHGYGPHQMLAALESGMVEAALECAPRWAIYQAAAFHVSRVAGLSPWDRHGPRYVLDAGGRAVRRGRYGEGGLRLPPPWAQRLERSYLVRWLGKHVRETTEADRLLYLAVVDEARRVVAERFPGSEFHVLYWDRYRDDLDERLEQRGLRVHRVSAILPGERRRYRLHPRDGHPNPLAHRLLADYVHEQIVEAPALATSDPARRRAAASADIR